MAPAPPSGVMALTYAVHRCGHRGAPVYSYSLPNSSSQMVREGGGESSNGAPEMEADEEEAMEEYDEGEGESNGNEEDGGGWMEV